MATKYGVIADVHEGGSNLNGLLEKMVNDGVDAFILNGDIGDSKEIMYNTLKKVGETKKPVYVQPGSHENVLDYFDAVDEAIAQYSNIHDVLDMDTPKVDAEDHHLAFIPGSDSANGLKFMQGNQDLDNGIYLIVNDDGKQILPKIKRSQLDIVRRYRWARDALFYVSNMDSLEDMVTEPENTIVFNHIPSKFDKETGVDYAHFLQQYGLQKDNQGNMSYMPTGSIIPATKKDNLKQQGIKIIETSEYNNDEQKVKEIMDSMAKDEIPMFLLEKKSSSGNQALRDVYKKQGILKVINNHIHEASHNAHDWEENPIAEDTYVPSLFYNAGCVADGKAGILMVDGNKVAYKNINL